ncbi:hypothetical protein H4219_003793 [Mycoemilia scoparia]|uniref:Uncharacterized protein n=1 Tax=Mycoemilia scoparia TaxID=417184 RepID=A0A9W7ZZG9_9FUNG|nr:hypothetical protein H4219_003793 [Mycoemilia scoparia]
MPTSPNYQDRGNPPPPPPPADGQNYYNAQGGGYDYQQNNTQMLDKAREDLINRYKRNRNISMGLQVAFIAIFLGLVIFFAIRIRQRREQDNFVWASDWYIFLMVALFVFDIIWLWFTWRYYQSKINFLKNNPNALVASGLPYGAAGVVYTSYPGAPLPPQPPPGYAHQYPPPPPSAAYPQNQANYDYYQPPPNPDSKMSNGGYPGQR